MTAAISPADARRWLDRWDRQQEFYIADREERFTVIADVVGHVVDRPDPLIVDLGAGPGSLSIRLLQRFPGAEVVAVDADPLLLGLARSAYRDQPGLRIVDHDLRASGWQQALRLTRAPDAIVSTTALHWLTRAELAGVYSAVGELLDTGGVFVNGDHLREPVDHERLNRLQTHVADCRARRVGIAAIEDWAAWWEAAGQASELAGLVGERGARPIEHTVPDPPTLADHRQLLRASGFREVGTVWQHGDDRVLAALR